MALANERTIQSVTKPCYTRARRVGTWTARMRAEPKYWSPAKRYGLGVGSAGQLAGPVVLVAFVALMAGGTYVFPPRKDLGG